MHPPRLIRTAGVLWMLVGALFVILACVSAAGNVLTRTKHRDAIRSDIIEACSLAVVLFIGVGAFIAGARLVHGSARDTIVPSILSILVGVFHLGFGVLAIVLSEHSHRDAPPEPVVVLYLGGLFSIFLGGGFLLPAGLALTGRSRYLAWRANPPSPPPRVWLPHYVATDEGDHLRRRGRADRGHPAPAAPESGSGISPQLAVSEASDKVLWRSTGLISELTPFSFVAPVQGVLLVSLFPPETQPSPDQIEVKIQVGRVSNSVLAVVPSADVAAMVRVDERQAVIIRIRPISAISGQFTLTLEIVEPDVAF